MKGGINPFSGIPYTMADIKNYEEVHPPHNLNSFNLTNSNKGLYTQKHY